MSPHGRESNPSMRVCLRPTEQVSQWTDAAKIETSGRGGIPAGRRNHGTIGACSTDPRLFRHRPSVGPRRTKVALTRNPCHEIRMPILKGAKNMKIWFCRGLKILFALVMVSPAIAKLTQNVQLLLTLLLSAGQLDAYPRICLPCWESRGSFSPSISC